MSAQRISSNEEKFKTGNPVVQRMIGRFFSALSELVEPLQAGSTLDAGCGEGETIARLRSLFGDSITAIDIDQQCIDRVRSRLPGVKAECGSVSDLAFPDGAFVLVLCLEVLEHVAEPGSAVSELARVSSRDLIVSVPFEPWFRIGSLLRGKYVRTLGNHPEHVNHFNKRTLAKLLAPVDPRAEIRVAFPWLIAHCRVGDDGSRAL